MVCKSQKNKKEGPLSILSKKALIRVYHYPSEFFSIK
jgi:hypothetical protein